MLSLNYSFHSHTSRCGHASGSDEEYVIEAIKSGIKKLGFSDHIFLPDMESSPRVRGDISLLDDYVTSVRNLSLKYKDKVDIYLGFEAETYGRKLTKFYKYLLKEKIDYLILGQHCTSIKKGKFYWYGRGDHKKDLKRYVRDVIKAMKSGLYTYFAHPDHFFLWYKDEGNLGEWASSKIAKASVKYDVPLEYNLCRPRKFRSLDGNIIGYPNSKFWEVVKNYPVKVVIGIDAHEPEAYKDEIMVDESIKYLKSLNLELIDPTDRFKRNKNLTSTK